MNDLPAATTDEWMPLEFKSQHPVAAVRLRFVQLFPPTASSWDEAQEHKSEMKGPSRGLTLDQLREMLNELVQPGDPWQKIKDKPRYRAFDRTIME